MKRSATLLTLAAVTAAFSACASPGPAADSSSGPAPSAPAESHPVGSAALFTEDQAARGRATFRSVCSECHYSSEFRGTQFQFEWRKRAVGDLYEEIVRNMPEDAPGSLSKQEYLDVVSYILELNGFAAGAQELTEDAAAMRTVTLEAPGGPDDAAARGFPETP